MSNADKEAITKDIEISRQLEAAFQVYVKDISPLVARALANAGTKRGTNKKYEWNEFSRERISTPITTALALGYLDATQKNVSMDTSNVLAWDTFRFETTGWVAISDLTMYVTEVVNSTTVKAIKIGWTDAAVASWSIAVFKSNLLPENSKKREARKIRVPNVKYNYFQIFDTLMENSRTLEGSDAIGDVGKIAFLRAEWFFDIQRQLTEILSYGTRVKFTDPKTNKEIYGAGWLAEFVVNSIDAGGNALTQVHLDDAVWQILKWGWRANTIRCGLEQAKALSKLDESKLLINLDETTRGNVVTSIQARIPVEGSKIDTIMVDFTMPEDEIDVFDISNIALIPYSNGAIREMDASEKGQDGNALRMIGEYTVEAKNFDKTAVKIKNLA